MQSGLKGCTKVRKLLAQNLSIVRSYSIKNLTFQTKNSIKYCFSIYYGHLNELVGTEFSPKTRPLSGLKLSAFLTHIRLKRIPLPPPACEFAPRVGRPLALEESAKT